MFRTLVTATKPFPGDDTSQTLARVIDREPDWTLLPADTPSRVRKALEVCLRKEAKRRFGDMASVRLVLEGTFDGPDQAKLPVTASSGGWRRSLSLAGLSVYRVTRPTPQRPMRFSIPAELYFSTAFPDVAISPDSYHLAYMSGSGGDGTQIMVRQLDQPDPSLPTGGGSYGPFFSTGSDWVGFFNLTEGSLQRVRVGGGPVDTILNLTGTGVGTLANPGGAAWGGDDSIIFATTDTETGLWRVSVDGGDLELLTTPDRQRGPTDHLWPEILPDGDAVVFTISANPIEDSEIAIYDLATEVWRSLGLRGTHAKYAASGHLVYALDGDLRAVGFDPDRRELIGEPFRVVEDVPTKSNGAANFGISRNGSLLYASGSIERTLGWVDRNTGQMTSLIDTGAIWGVPRLSPDGRSIALVKSGDSDEIWIRDLQTDREIRLTEPGTSNRWPVWSPDGTRVAFGSPRNGTFDIFVRPVNLSEGTVPLLEDASSVVPGAWFEETLLYNLINPETRRDVWRWTDGQTAPVVDGSGEDYAARFSPKGQWLAYVSNRDGEHRVYVERYPESTGVIPISTGRGTEPVWSRDGSELFYRDGTQMFAVSMADPENPGTPRPLFPDPYDPEPILGGHANYDVSLDGQQFLMVQTNDSDSGLTLILNWFETLKERVPVP